MKKNNIARWGISLAAAAAALVLLSTRTSPLYPLLMGSYVGNDVSAIMLIAKYWIAGEIVPYRELFAMGGPLYFLIHAAGWMLGGRTGVLVLQILNLAAFLMLTGKIARRYADGKAAVLFSLAALIPYAALCAGGSSAEEWCLTLSAAVLYLGLTRTECKTTTALILGLLTGCVVMTDLGSAGICLGILAVTVLRKKNTILPALAGLILPTALCWGYFAAMGCGSNFLLGALVYPVQELALGFESLNVILHKCVKVMLVLPAAAAALVLLRRNTRDGLVLLVAALVCGMSLLLGNNRWVYYLAVLPLLAPALAVLWSLVRGRLLALGTALVLVLAICAVPARDYALYLTGGIPEVYDLFHEDTIEAQKNLGQSPRYMSLDTDSCFFLLLDTRPVNRYFTGVATLAQFDAAVGQAVKADLDGAVEADFLLITERGFHGQELDNYQMVEVYLKLGGSLFVYLPVTPNT